MPLSTSPVRPLLAALREFFGLGGYGTVEYEVGTDGDLVHARTIVTTKPRNAAERMDVEVFVERLRKEHGLLPSDTLKLSYQDGRLETATITRIRR